MINPKKFCLVNDIIAIRILISDLQDRLEVKTQELLELDLKDAIMEERNENEESNL